MYDPALVRAFAPDIWDGNDAQCDLFQSLAEISFPVLLGASGLSEIDFEQCPTLFSGELLALCETARAQEEIWVNFKLFGMMGLTLAFVIAQAFYLARHVIDDEAEDAA